MVRTTIHLPAEFHQEIKRAARERGSTEAELIRTAIRNELLGATADRQRISRRAHLLAATGKLDSSIYPAGYLDELRAGWRD